MLTLALMAGIYAANLLVGCSEEKPSNPIESAAPATDNTQTPTDTSTAADSRDQRQEMTAASWNTLSEMSKRQLILQTALNENGWDTDYTCKTWAQHIVSKASGGSAWLPKNCRNAYDYYYCPMDHVTQILQNQSAAYTHFMPGRVLQMWYGGPNKPHTALIYSSSPSGMQWLDCNWVGGAGKGIVGIHYISWSDFYRNANAFTLYEVY